MTNIAMENKPFIDEFTPLKVLIFRTLNKLFGYSPTVHGSKVGVPPLLVVPKLHEKKAGSLGP